MNNFNGGNRKESIASCRSDQSDFNKQIIQRMKKSKLKINKNQSEQAQSGLSLAEKFDNIWEYIKFQSNLSTSHIQKSQQQEQSEGVYFKLKQKIPIQQEVDSLVAQKSKQLQVFSNIIQNKDNSFVVTTIRDMSHWIELERQKNLTVAKTLAFASAAHEFRNPLGAIINSLDLMKDSLDMQKAEKFYLTAKNCSNLMLYLVNDILDYSQIETKSLVLNVDQINVKIFLEECISILQFRADLKRILLCYQLESGFPDTIQSDENRLRQILLNLISNAIKYTNQGFVRINCFILKNQLQDKVARLCFEVEDSGVGIEKIDQQRLFQAYCKNFKNRYLNKQGCGLGLTISKNLALALNGDINVTSEIDKGSKFTLMLPIYKQSNIEQEFVYKKGLANKKRTLQIEYVHRQHPYINKETKKQKNSFIKYGMEQDLSIDFETPQISEINNYDLDHDINQTSYSNQNQHQLHKNIGGYLRNQKKMKLIYRQRSNSISSHKDLTDLDQEQESLNLSDEESKIAQVEICNCAKILVVDDDPFNIIALEGMLNQLGIVKIEKLFNGKDAINHLVKVFESTNQQKFELQNKTCNNHQPYKLILLDNQMPFKTGIQVAQELKSMYGDLIEQLNIKLAMISGDGDLLQNHIYQETFDYLLQKPLSVSRLRQIIVENGLL
ncbi:multi-sensor hybrid histidine kinase [Stylonychia lemnae]|uniref:Multi-sensor hybrid histidine kinase n=1 Tax=Stylonychia lemnae TaxID=5949 RepID=A0A078AJD6_STYLE|nr:multi-sensor hybrid histidine kinase [Stylonychia lemnae]|eukprot:CDW81597.1 multi-sensor hybrid histidine kinase [Stylonychia lemnae]